MTSDDEPGLLDHRADGRFRYGGLFNGFQQLCFGDGDRAFRLLVIQRRSHAGLVPGGKGFQSSSGNPQVDLGDFHGVTGQLSFQDFNLVLSGLVFLAIDETHIETRLLLGRFRSRLLKLRHQGGGSGLPGRHCRDRFCFHGDPHFELQRAHSIPTRYYPHAVALVAGREPGFVNPFPQSLVRSLPSWPWSVDFNLRGTQIPRYIDGEEIEIDQFAILGGFAVSVEIGRNREPQLVPQRSFWIFYSTFHRCLRLIRRIDLFNELGHRH